jgi:DNA-binding NtrC family response regulator
MSVETLEKVTIEHHDETNQNSFSRRHFIGRSSAFRSINEKIKMIAEYNCPVIISGETGTGKEIVSQKIHTHSARHKAPFIPVDCTTMNGPLFESQLFGHVKGSFTGAVSDSLGFFRAADGGTIFLDEIAELDQELQPKLLRVLQESCVVPVGAAQARRIDVRIICATNRDLQKMVHDGKFREDLYYRLDVIHLKIPPLRDRREDIIPLAEYYLDRQADLYKRGRKKLTNQTEQLLLHYNWPGNVRELANVIERAYIMSGTDEIRAEALRINLLPMDRLSGHGQPFPSLDDVNRKLIIRALQTSNGHIMETAQLLKISYGKLHRLINKYKLRSEYK